MADETEGFEDEGGRINSLNDMIRAAVAEFLGGAHKDATKTTEAKLDQPGSIADEVQAELGRRDAAAKQAERDAMVGKHDEVLRQLTEKAPEAPPRRVERMMGWKS